MSEDQARSRGRRTSGARRPASLVLVGVMAVIGFVTSVPAGAHPAATIILSPSVGPPTTVVTTTGSGFGPDEVIDVSFDGRVSSTSMTDQSGAFVERSTVGARLRPGYHTVEAVGETSGLSASAQLLVRTDWGEFRFDDSHSGYNPYENVLKPGNVSRLELDWTRGMGFIEASPTVVGGIVYQGSGDNKLYALDATTGTLVWTFQTSSDVQSSAAVEAGVVYVGGSSDWPHGNVYAIDASTGALLWTYQSPKSIESSVVVADGIVYAGSHDGHVYALDASTGTLVWSYRTGDEVFSTPAVAGGVVYLGSTDHHVYAFDAALGTLLWTFEAGSSIYSSPAVAGGMVYIGSSDAKLYALNATTGALVWSYPTNQFVYSSPAVADGVVYVGSGDHNVYALDAATGAPRWSFTTDNYVYSSPALANGVVYVGSFGGIAYALDAATGEELWSVQLGGNLRSPAVVNGMLYVGSFEHRLYAFHLP